MLTTQLSTGRAASDTATDSVGRTWAFESAPIAVLRHTLEAYESYPILIVKQHLTEYMVISSDSASRAVAAR